jgi:hypothetical protein
MKAYACKISLPVTNAEIRADVQKADKILNDVRPVSVKYNVLLDAIMCKMNEWKTSPIIWVDNYPYRIVLLDQKNDSATLLQVCLGVYYKTNGKETYYVINKRKVVINYE